MFAVVTSGISPKDRFVSFRSPRFMLLRWTVESNAGMMELIRNLGRAGMSGRVLLGPAAGFQFVLICEAASVVLSCVEILFKQRRVSRRPAVCGIVMLAGRFLLRQIGSRDDSMQDGRLLGKRLQCGLGVDVVLD